jgi:hypothetical protein
MLALSSSQFDPQRILGLLGRSASAGANFATRWVVQACYSWGIRNA